MRNREALTLGLLLAALMVALLAARPAAALDTPVQAWGSNDFGQLGDGTAGSSNSSNTPVGVTSFSGASRVDGGCLHSLALKKGKLYGWGSNEFGQLGAQTPDFYSSTPVKVQTASGKPFGGVARISVGCVHNLALKNGKVFAWGNNESGELGNGTKGVGTPESRPAKVAGLSNVKAVSAGGGFSLALKKDGTVYAWGNNESGQLGSGSNAAYSLAPVKVSNLTHVKAIYASSYHALAVEEDGTVWTWGSNLRGQLGDGTTGGESNTPVQVQVWSGYALIPLTNVKGVAGGLFHSLALKNDGTVYAWGGNASGQLGNGTTGWPNTCSCVDTAVQVRQPDLGGSTPLTGVKAISAGRSFSLALKTDGTVRAWGLNDVGQLGDGTNDPHNLAVAVRTDGGDALEGIKAIGAGQSHSLAVKQ